MSKKTSRKYLCIILVKKNNWVFWGQEVRLSVFRFYQFFKTVFEFDTFRPQARKMSTATHTWSSCTAFPNRESENDVFLYLIVKSSRPVSRDRVCLGVSPSMTVTAIKDKENVWLLDSPCFCIVTMAHNFASGKEACEGIRNSNEENYSRGKHHSTKQVGKNCPSYF